MRRLSQTAVLGICVALIAAAVTPLARSAEAIVELKWSELVPPAPPKPPKSFLSGRPDQNAAPVLPPGPEARWMSTPAQSNSVSIPEVVGSLDGKHVRIGGYVVPLDFDATRVKEFLLVPFVGACIHVPPPPANQIIYVKSAAGFDVKGSFDAVTVVGKLTTTVAFTGLAEAGYTLDAEVVEPRAE